MYKILLTLSLVLVSFAHAKHPQLQTVESVDLDRYLGKWYEIARFDQRFQKGCTAVTAEYIKRKNGTIKVINKCRLGSPEGKQKVAVGRARVVSKSNAKLRVQFFLRWLPIKFLSGRYWILALGEDYEYAMVGDPSRKFLWILSRENTLDEDIYLDLVQQAEDSGFDTSKLLRTVH